jgi:hypothetical protein
MLILHRFQFCNVLLFGASLGYRFSPMQRPCCIGFPVSEFLDLCKLVSKEWMWSSLQTCWPLSSRCTILISYEWPCWCFKYLSEDVINVLVRGLVVLLCSNLMYIDRLWMKCSIQHKVPSKVRVEGRCKWWLSKARGLSTSWTWLEGVCPMSLKFWVQSG